MEGRALVMNLLALLCAAVSRFGDREGVSRWLPMAPCSCGDWGRWHDNQKVTPGCCVAQTVYVLKSIVSVLETHGIPYTLDGGTLLGAQRCGKMIPWDYDADLTAYAEPEVFERARRQWTSSWDSSMPRVTGAWGDVGSTSVGDVHIDIGNQVGIAPKLEHCLFHGRVMTCLANSSQHLSKIYGTNWRTPRRWCNWSEVRLCAQPLARDVQNMCT